MKRQIIKLISFTILIGVLALVFNTAFGNQTITYLQKEQINMIDGRHFYIWKYDFWTYLKNLQMSITDLSILQFKMPTRSWDNTWDLTDWGSTLGNNMLVILDYIIMVINIMLYPFKIGAYFVRNLTAIMGINQDTTNAYNGLSWLIIFVRDILGNIAIPYL